MSHLPEAISSASDPKQLTCDALVVGAYATDNGPVVIEGPHGLNEAMNGYLDDLPAAGFKGKLGEVLLIPTLDRIAPRLICVTGLGSKATVIRATVCSAAATAAKRLSAATEISSILHLALDDTVEAARAAVEGYALGSYRFVKYKSDPRPSKIQRVMHIDADQAALELASITAEATTHARDLINEPASSLTPEAMARAAREIADVAGLGCEIWDEDKLKQDGFGGILAVASGSENPPRLIRLHYKPASPSAKVTLVGKGVTFDSGGLSIKPAASMELMKTDMAGGAVVLAVMAALPRIGVDVEVEALVPAAENMTGGGAMRPGDVIVHRGGKTTEVTNTDAEGRLILADAIAYASESSPDVIVDVATLTGSMTVAIGKKASGLFSNDDGLRDDLLAAADTVGERTWAFPLYEDYINELDSDVADHKNSGIRWGGAIIAAMYLKQFVGKDIAWAHMDIAGTGRSERDYLEIARGGTGIPVRTLIEWLRTRFS